MSTKRQKFAVNVERRQWDLEAFASQAAEREQTAEQSNERQSGQTKAPLQARTQSVDASIHIGKVERGEGGFPCALCNCVVKDHRTYLDHINGKAHQAKLGRAMRNEKVGADAVRDQLAAIQANQSNKPIIGIKRKTVDHSATKTQSIVARTSKSDIGESTKPIDAAAVELSSASVPQSDQSVETGHDDETDAMAAMGFDFSSFTKGKKR